MRAFAALFLTSLAAVAAVPAMAQSNDTYAFCYADPPTYRSGTFVFTQVRHVGTGEIDLFEAGSAMAGASPQVRGRQVQCWRYPNEQIAEARRQEGMARERSRGYTMVESEWTPTRIANIPAVAPAPAAVSPEAVPATSSPAATIVATPVADAAAQPTAPLPPVSQPAAAGSVAADIDRAIGQSAPAAVAAPAPMPQPAPDTQQGAVANLNAGIVAREAARLDAAAQVQADYQRQLAEHARQVEEIRQRNAKAQADYEAAVKACAAGDFSKCGGPPVPVKKAQ